MAAEKEKSESVQNLKMFRFELLNDFVWTGAIH